MPSIDELTAALTANKQAAEELSAQIEASKQMAEELHGAAETLGFGGPAAALQSAKAQLDQAAAQSTATATQLEEALTAAEASKHT